MRPERELAYWPDFHTEIFFLFYGGDTNCFVRAGKPETAMKIYYKWKEVDYGYCNYTEVRPRMVQQVLSDDQLKQLQRDNIVQWDASQEKFTLGD